MKLKSSRGVTRQEEAVYEHGISLKPRKKKEKKLTLIGLGTNKQISEVNYICLRPKIFSTFASCYVSQSSFTVVISRILSSSSSSWLESVKWYSPSNASSTALTMINVWLFLLIDTGIVRGRSLSDIKHVVLFMQENRAFDHARMVSLLEFELY